MDETSDGAERSPAIPALPHLKTSLASVEAQQAASSSSSSSLPSRPEAALPQAVDDDDISCLICLASSQDVEDRAILPACLHSLFCFPCILRWSQLKRSCPLCNRAIGPYLLHDVQSERDYKRYYLRPESLNGDAKAQAIDNEAARQSIEAERLRRQRRQLTSSRRGPPPIAPREGERRGWTEAARQELPSDELYDPFAEQERLLDRRRMVYRQGLYALHVGSNRHSAFRACPTYRQMVAAPYIIDNLLPFLRREILAMPLGPSVDVRFLVTYVVSIIKSMDIRSEGASKLLAELFGDDDDSEGHNLADHFCHEVMTFLRSGARTCKEFDAKAQYCWPWMRSVSSSASKRARTARPDARPGPSASTSAAKAVDSDAQQQQQQQQPPPDVPERTKADQSLPDEAQSSLTPSREDVIARRGRLLARLAEEKQKSGVPAETAPAPSAESRQTQQASTAEAASNASSSSSRERLLRRLAFEKRQLAPRNQ